MASALFSRDRRYRYLLTRTLAAAGQRPVTFLMLNPSTADESENDPTIRRCVGFASKWGHTELRVVNLFALCATDPRDLVRATRPTGRNNYRHIRDAIADSDQTVCAWGAHPLAVEPARKVLDMLRNQGVVDRLMCLGLTQQGHPRHPLYVRSSTQPIPFHPS